MGKNKVAQRQKMPYNFGKTHFRFHLATSKWQIMAKHLNIRNSKEWKISIKKHKLAVGIFMPLRSALGRICARGNVSFYGQHRGGVQRGINHVYKGGRLSNVFHKLSILLQLLSSQTPNSTSFSLFFPNILINT